MQLKLDMSCHLLNVYTKFQIDISKHVEERPENADGRTDGYCQGIIRPFFKRAYNKLAYDHLSVWSIHLLYYTPWHRSLAKHWSDFVQY